jgi:hypothetical protein
MSGKRTDAPAVRPYLLQNQNAGTEGNAEIYICGLRSPCHHLINEKVQSQKVCLEISEVSTEFSACLIDLHNAKTSTFITTISFPSFLW